MNPKTETIQDLTIQTREKADRIRNKSDCEDPKALAKEIEDSNIGELLNENYIQDLVKEYPKAKDDIESLKNTLELLIEENEGQNAEKIIKELKVEQSSSDEFKIDWGNDNEDIKKNDIANQFSEWIARETEQVKTFKLDPERNSKQIWYYDSEEKVWNKGGEDKLGEIAYNQLPDYHTKNFEREIKTKVHRIEPIHIDKTGTEKGKTAVKNGILNIEAQELEKINKDDYLTSKIPVEYDLEVNAPDKFIKFLQEVTRSEQDIKKLQEFIGYCLMTETAKYEKALMILGPTDSGKTVFLDVIRELLGENNVAQQSLQDLTNGPQWELANLVGNIANIDHDLDPDAIEDIGTVKKLTSGNPMTVEAKWQQPYDYTPTVKHLFSANRTPSREKEDEAFYNRWLTVVFPKSIPKDEQDKELSDKLTTEEELKGVLNWAIAGYHRLESQGKFTGENDAYATREIWKEWGNSVERFISKFMISRSDKIQKLKKEGNINKDEIKDIKCRVHSSTAYEVYQKYAVGMDMEVKNQQAFNSEVKKIKRVKKKNIRVNGAQGQGFQGIELIEDADKKVQEQIERQSSW